MQRQRPTIERLVLEMQAKRDALMMYHGRLKRENDRYNKWVISLSLINGMIESTKMQLGLTADGWALAPIMMSSLIAIISALVKFEDYPGRMETAIKAIGIITNNLKRFRDELTIVASDDEISAYSESLENLEIALIPKDRQRFIKESCRMQRSIRNTMNHYLDDFADSESDAPVGPRSPWQRAKIAMGVTGKKVYKSPRNNIGVTDEHSSRYIGDTSVIIDEPLSEQITPIMEPIIAHTNDGDDIITAQQETPQVPPPPPNEGQGEQKEERNDP